MVNISDFTIFRYWQGWQMAVPLQPQKDRITYEHIIMKRAIFILFTIHCSLFTALAQVNAGDSVLQHVKGNRLSVGGYGEVGYSREFYSDHVNRYSSPQNYKDDPSHGKFDIPHAVIYMGYDFGKGWTLGTEIEFEHTGTGSAIENEADEAAEWDREQEKGG